MMADVIEVFFSYAHEDEELMNDVRRQLVIFERNGRILKWHDRQIPAGAEWRKEIDVRLERAKIVLLFVSPHFIDSRYCCEVEGQAALRRHEAGEARVVPVILRPCSWHEAPFGKLQALPRDARPISQWDDRDEATLDVARGVMAIVDELMETDKEVGRPVPISQNAGGGTLDGDQSVRVTRAEREVISVNIMLVSSGVRFEAELPMDAQVRHILPEILRALKVPTVAATGHPIWWQLHSKDRGVTLVDKSTVRQNGVQPGETLILLAELTAG